MLTTDSKKEPAFPVERYSQSGLTKREYIATQVLQGMLAGSYPQCHETSMCSQAVTYTDQLIKELNK